jgi:hypothetical protein
MGRGGGRGETGELAGEKLAGSSRSETCQRYSPMFPSCAPLRYLMNKHRIAEAAGSESRLVKGLDVFLCPDAVIAMEESELVIVEASRGTSLAACMKRSWSGW